MSIRKNVLRKYEKERLIIDNEHRVFRRLKTPLLCFTLLFFCLVDFDFLSFDWCFTDFQVYRKRPNVGVYW